MQTHTTSQSSRFPAPQRISITLPQHVFDALLDRSAIEGRSLSNLSAYLLECSLQEEPRVAGGSALQPRLAHH